MKKKNIMLAVLAVVFLMATLIGFYFWEYNRNEQHGKNKFYKVMTELRSESPEIDNSCLGTSALRGRSFNELNELSEEQIKGLILKDPGSC